MCYFLTASVPDAVRDLLEQLDGDEFAVWENTNPSVRKLLPANTTPFWVTNGHCSCDLCPTHVKRFDEDAERRKYQKRGWGPAKIERALAAKRPTGLPVPPKLQRLYEALRGLMPRLGTVHLFGHSYRGDQTKEPVVASGFIETTFEAFLEAGGRFDESIVISLRSSSLTHS